MLFINSLSIGFKTESTPRICVHDVSLKVHLGESVALIGESGSGKTITALSILGLLPKETVIYPKGSISFLGQELLRQSEDLLRRYRGSQIGVIFQEPMTALNPLHTIEKQITESLLVHTSLIKRERFERLKELLSLVDFPEGLERLNAYPHQLSGGQRQRVMIAMALACSPKLLIADEPTTALDVTIQASIVDLLKKLQKKLNMGLLLVSHDLSMVKKLADTVCVMKEGVLVETGKVETLINGGIHPYTKHLIDSEPSGHAVPLQPNLEPLLTIKDIVVAFDQKKSFFQKSQKFLAVDHVSCSLNPGETLGIVGESGSGKSTLAYALMHLIKLDKGTIQFEGKELSILSAKKMKPFRKDIQIIFQDPFGSLNPRLPIFKLLEEGLKVHHEKLSSKERDTQICGILSKVGLSHDIKDRYPHEFSGGQRQRISIARALILKPKLLILDEPTSALDRSIQAELLTFLKSLQIKEGLGYIFISHDLKVIRSMSHRILVMRQGRVIEDGETENIFLNPQTHYTQTLIKASF